MSDPVTNVEIEDVLSSIRRLVSTDGRDDKARGTRADQPTGTAPEAKEDDSDRLVLTPSLRVDNSQAEPEPGPEDAGRRRTSRRRTRRSNPRTCRLTQMTTTPSKTSATTGP